MSDDSYATGEVISAERSLSPRLEKVFKGLIIVTVLLVAAELIWFFLISPCMPLSRVELSGFLGLDRGLILTQAGIDERSSYMAVNPRAAERALAALPPIESARVLKTFPSQVEILLTGRTPLAASLVEVSGRPALVIFDKQGVIFRILNPGAPEASAFPLVSGLNFRDPRLGSRPQSESFYTSFLEKLALIRSSAPELFLALSEIQINRKIFEEADGKTFGSFDLTLYLIHKPVRVRTGADLDEASLRYILLTVDALFPREPRIDEIDFRAGIASYTLKEASSG